MGSAEIATTDVRCLYISQDKTLFYSKSLTRLRSVAAGDIL